ncbi:DEAD/DEAH box helicase [Alkalicoccus luteus]|uniref:DEAD/DEAH box helicase family protein n=1 Tax=Alkalicoccus luteus TaxID=1237094 RepID=A0A969PQV8_9BACI|nr:DEAD/DEAH box helicase [Alkalicoccus luteus]NJP38750.1 DEAD/DEAH box helicase family protein [Alkalicoccus luteus]
MRLTELTLDALQDEVQAPEQLKIARVYLQEESVKEMLWDQEKKRFRIYVERYRQRFAVDIYPDSMMEIKQSACSCDRSGICVHILAALLYMGENRVHAWLAERDPSFTVPNPLAVSSRQDRETASLLAEFESLFVPPVSSFESSEKTKLHIQFELKLYPSFYKEAPGTVELELKAGIERLYIVRSLPGFLHAVQNGEAYRFTDKFSFYPEEHALDEDDLAVLKEAAILVNVQQMYEDRYAVRKEGDMRSFDIPAPFAASFFQLLSGRNVVVIAGEGKKQPFRLEELGTPFRFEAEEVQEGAYTLYWKDGHQLQYFGGSFPVCYYKDRFLWIPEEQRSVIEKLYYQLSLAEKPLITFSSAYLEPLASVLLPQLKAVGTVKTAEALEHKIDMIPLKARLLLDYSANRLTAEVVFQYGHVEINPFREQENRGERIIVRDMKQEYRLMALVEEAPLKYNGSELFIDHFPDLLYFLSSWLPVLSEQFEVYLPASLRDLIYLPEQAPEVTAEVDEGTGELSVHISTEAVPQDELDAIVEAVMEGRRYYEREDGTFIPLHDVSFDAVRELMERYRTAVGGKPSASMTLPLKEAFHLEEARILSARTASFQKLIQRLLDPSDVDFEEPDKLKADMRDYQRTGYQWMTSLDHYGFGGVLADDMGLGKTLQTIAFIAGRKERGPLKQTLILCPSSVTYNWKKELERFAPHLKAGIIGGTKSEREEQFAQYAEADVLISSYPVLRRDHSMFRERYFDILILDEAQNVKNAGTKTAKAVRDMQCKTAFALSGTPIENSLEELYSIFQIVLPGLFTGKDAFQSLKEETIAARIRPFILRRRKTDVLRELPEKLESVEYTELTQAQRTLYATQLQLLKREASEARLTDSWKEKSMQILAGLTRLRQICSHPGMFMEDYEGGSEKLERLMEYTEEALINGRRIVIFSQFTTMLALMKERFDKRGADYFYLDGKTPAEERVTMAERFNNGEHDLFLVSLKAGGTGLNLTGGDTVILFDSWWNPAVEDQAADRVYRFGQKKVVQVTKMIAAGTIEEKIHEMQARKRDLLDRVVQPGETMLKSLGREEIEELLELNT